MKDKVTNILDDLYKIDGNLQQHEDKLKEYILVLEKMKPDTEFSEEFNQRLRKQLIQKIEFQKSNIVEKKSKFTLYFITKRFFSGAFFSLLMLFGIFSVLNLQVIQQKDTNVILNKSDSNNIINYSINSAIEDGDSFSTEMFTSDELTSIALDSSDSQDFKDNTKEKSLNKMQPKTNQLGEMENLIEDSPEPQMDNSQGSSKGVESLVTSSDEFVSEDSIESSPRMLATDSSIDDRSSLSDETAPSLKAGFGGGYAGFAPDQQGGFVYNEDLGKLYNEAVKLSSYKIQGNEGVNYNIDTMFQNISFTGLNLGKVSKSSIGSMSYNVESNGKYKLTVNFESGEIDITNIDLTNGVTNNSFGINPKIDSKFIEKIANEFIKTFGINLSNYGSGELLDYGSYGNISVYNYPMILDGKLVGESWGDSYGIKLEIDRIKGTVIRAFNINFKQLTKISNNNFIQLTQLTKDLKNDNENSVKLTNPRVIYTKVYADGGVYFVPGIKFDYNDFYSGNIASYVLPINNIGN